MHAVKWTLNARSCYPPPPPSIGIAWPGKTKARRKYRIKEQCAFPDVERAVYMWHQDQRRRGFSVSGAMLIEKAETAFAILHPRAQKWEPTTGWLDGFKERYDIRCLKVAGESRSADVPAARNYVHHFRQKYPDLGARECVMIIARPCPGCVTCCVDTRCTEAVCWGCDGC
jgi:hypothetical protein